MENNNFENFDEIKVNKNRCMGFTINGKRCRTRLRKNQYLFCCENHKPYNSEIIEDGCFCCMEKIINHKDGILFKCKHLVHKKCFEEWIKNSTYETPICIICRGEVYNNNKKRIIKLYEPSEDLYDVKNYLEEIVNEKNDNLFKNKEVFNYNNQNYFLTK